MRLTVPCHAAMHGGRTKSDLVTVPSKHGHAPLVVFQSRARCSGTSPHALQQGRGDARAVSACVARSHANPFLLPLHLGTTPRWCRCMSGGWRRHLLRRHAWVGDRCLSHPPTATAAPTRTAAGHQSPPSFVDNARVAGVGTTSCSRTVPHRPWVVLFSDWGVWPLLSTVLRVTASLCAHLSIVDSSCRSLGPITAQQAEHFGP